MHHSGTGPLCNLETIRIQAVGSSLENVRPVCCQVVGRRFLCGLGFHAHVWRRYIHEIDRSLSREGGAVTMER